MNLKTQNKDSSEDAVSNSPDPSKQEEGFGKNWNRCEDWEGNEQKNKEVVGKKLEEPACLSAVVFCAAVSGSPYSECLTDRSSISLNIWTVCHLMSEIPFLPHAIVLKPEVTELLPASQYDGLTWHSQMKQK